ncbi:MAG: hypothetical protein AAB794_01975 [Patescibacteria group bacterium]
MDPELKQTLTEIRAFTKDNHDMLRAIRRHQWYGLITSIIFWLAVLITPFYLYQQYLQPIVSKFSTAPSGTTSGNSTITEIQKLINSFKAGQR